MNKITIELCAEDRKRIDELMASIGLLTGELRNTQPPKIGLHLPRIEQAEDGTVKLVKETTPTAEHPADASITHLEPVDAPAPAPITEPAPVEPVPTEPTPEVKPVSLAEFQKAVTMVCAKGATQKAAAKDIINKYAASVSTIPEDKRHEVMAALAKL